MITAMPRIAIAVHDFEETVSTFRGKLGMPVIDFSDSSVASLGARLGMCVPEGGSNIELMSPADPDAPLSQSLQRFLDRRGEGLFALMLEAPDPDAEAEALSRRGLDVLPLMAGAGGRDVHPRSTHGVLIRVYPNDSFKGTTDDTSAAPELSGIARVVLAVADAARAGGVYGKGLGLEVADPVVDPDRGVETVLCTPAKGGRIELVSVVDRERPFAARVARHLEERPEGMYALVLQTEDPDAAADLLEARGLAVDRTEKGVEAALFGARLHIEER